jgi:hypothetical protein
MNKAERRQESERLRDVLTHIRDHLDVLVEHLEEDVLLPRMVAASAHHLTTAAMAGPSFAFLSMRGGNDPGGDRDRQQRRL